MRSALLACGVTVAVLSTVAGCAGADDRRAEIASWLKTVSVGDSRAMHPFDGYTVVVEHFPPGTISYGPSLPAGRDGSVLGIRLTGGDRAPGGHD